MEFFTTLKTLLDQPDPDKKCDGFAALFSAWNRGELPMEHDGPVKPWAAPSYAAFCTVVPPDKVPKRKNLTGRGLVELLHAITHIEYSAVDLALDAAYRFRNLPEDFYREWLVVAEDEIRHFKMLTALLEKVECRYGDLPVHSALFEAAKASPDLLRRMAAVPRYLEAGGLDANPKIMAKLARYDDPFYKEVLETLRVILEEEIDHVAKGDRWFKYACDRAGLGYDCYFDLIEEVLPGSSAGKREVNVEARKAAGFSCGEIRRIAPGQECSD